MLLGGLFAGGDLIGTLSTIEKHLALMPTAARTSEIVKSIDPTKILVFVTVTPSPTSTPIPFATATSSPSLINSLDYKTHKIAFARWDGGKHNLFIANTDGSDEQFLIERAAGPSWSSDGQYLSFYGEAGIDRQELSGRGLVTFSLSDGILWLRVSAWSTYKGLIYVGQDIGQYVQDGSGRWTAWAPTGGMIAFDAIRGNSGRCIHFVSMGDNDQFRIEFPGEQADWSPDSSQLVYRSGRDNKQGIWISNRDDSNAHNITNDRSDAFPVWSPDSREIAFHRNLDGNVDIYVMNIDGSDIRRLTDMPNQDTLPTWTPDGRLIFRSARTGSWGIYIMNADGSNQHQIILNADPGPDWSFGRMDVY
jgi:hypothetical protein